MNPMADLYLLVLYTPTIEKTCAFYELLGLQFTKEQHGNGPVHYSCLLGDTVLELYPGVCSNARLGFTVNSLDDVVSALQKNGYAVKITGDRAIARDPDGRTVELTKAL
ncbi:glyoxalase/bleomycin resistance/extradiol dioxygenase family protein [Candidatus Woesearchaeota archaeon]|nr:glyoxalase/bleomycin resistance/extradiol dioxygenase family protein [Candidatus Woesearchaeota archaeon]